jgi:hypothetical protein
MIKDRPKHLMNQGAYGRIPAEPFAVHFDILPELVRKSLGPLAGIQPVTGAMMKAASNQLKDMPCEAEIGLFRKAGAVFQMISVVVSLAHMNRQDGVLRGIPYALTLQPASKRDAVQECGIDLVSKLDLQKLLNEMEPCYVGFDPFTGSYTLFGSLSLFVREKPYRLHRREQHLSWPTRGRQPPPAPNRERAHTGRLHLELNARASQRS